MNQVAPSQSLRKNREGQGAAAMENAMVVDTHELVLEESKDDEEEEDEDG